MIRLSSAANDAPEPLGFGAFYVTNIFAFRETDPYKMRQHHDPIGPENDAQINEACLWADKIVAAWGTHGAHLKRGPWCKPT